MPNPALTLEAIRPGARFIETRIESRGLARYMVEVSDKRFTSGDRDGAGADDIELIYLFEVDADGAHVADLEFPVRFRVPHGAVLGEAYQAVPLTDVTCRNAPGADIQKQAA